MLLVDFIRHKLKAYGTHVGCEHGVCGACTISFNGRPTRSCLVYAVQAEGATIETIEGLAGQSGELGPLQAAFTKHHALQCGFCTAGILISANLFLRENADPTADDVRQMLSGHICRCTGYYPIIAAIMDASRAFRASRENNP